MKHRLSKGKTVNIPSPERGIPIYIYIKKNKNKSKSKRRNILYVFFVGCVCVYVVNIINWWKKKQNTKYNEWMNEQMNK